MCLDACDVVILKGHHGKIIFFKTPFNHLEIDFLKIFFKSKLENQEFWLFRKIYSIVLINTCLMQLLEEKYSSYYG